MDKSNESIWKNFKSAFPYLYFLIVILNLIKQGIYYFHFNIGIQDYIGLSELLLPIANFATPIMAFILICCFYLWFVENNPVVVYRREKLIMENAKWTKIFWTEIRVTLFSLVAGIIFSIIGEWLFVFTLVAVELIIIYPVISYFIIKNLDNSYQKKLNPYLLLVPLFITLIIFFIIGTVMEENKVENGIYSGTKIYTKDTTYFSNSVHYYIGKTTNYYFIFNKDRQSSTIIPEREVIKFELKENEISVRSQFKGN